MLVKAYDLEHFFLNFYSTDAEIEHLQSQLFIAQTQTMSNREKHLSINTFVFQVPQFENHGYYTTCHYKQYYKAMSLVVKYLPKKLKAKLFNQTQYYKIQYIKEI